MTLIQLAMVSRFTSAIVTVGLLFIGFTSQAQYTFASVAAPATTEAGSALLSEEGPRATAYKVIHGVVQGKQGALPGATVMLHGTRTIAVTNAEGEFELRVPADAKVVELTCSYGGLQEEVVRFAAVQALGSVYLLRPAKAPADQLATN